MASLTLRIEERREGGREGVQPGSGCLGSGGMEDSRSLAGAASPSWREGEGAAEKEECLGRMF